MDGGFGSESLPRELDSAADLGRIGKALQPLGYGPEDIEAIMGANWLRILQQGLPE
jgi:microsomal dipeptidase-like Zn-dependent dipeptidase